MLQVNSREAAAAAKCDLGVLRERNQVCDDDVPSPRHPTEIRAEALLEFTGRGANALKLQQGTHTIF